MSVQQWLERLEAAIAAADWKRASAATDALRMGGGWKYSRFVEVFGERWEEYAQAMDQVDTEDGAS